jgi:methylmalonyl-CoA/ethylmalonyl-CoA epimerase
MAVKRIDHIAVVVPDIEASLAFWRDQLGLDLSHVLAVPEQQATIAFLPTGGSEVELVQPTTTDSGLARFLAKRGPGIHHICLEVDDIAQTLTDLKARGVRLIDETPKSGAGGKKLAFIHPESANGVLVELYELPTS